MVPHRSTDRAKTISFSQKTKSSTMTKCFWPLLALHLSNSYFYFTCCHRKFGNNVSGVMPVHTRAHKDTLISRVAKVPENFGSNKIQGSNCGRFFRKQHLHFIFFVESPKVFSGYQEVYRCTPHCAKSEIFSQYLYK